MILKSIDKKKNIRLCDELSERLIKHPLFMLFCPSQEERQSFIRAYLYYYIFEWSEYDTLIADSGRSCLASLIDPHTFEYRFKGKGARALKKSSHSKEIFNHRRLVKEIVHIIAPGFM